MSSTKKKTKEVKVKGWAQIFPAIVRSKPLIHWQKPTQEEIKMGLQYGYNLYPCEITYTLPPQSNKK